MRWRWAAVFTAGLLCGCSGAQSRKASYLAHGKSYLDAANYDKARVEFSNAAQIDPSDPDVRFFLGQTAEKLGDTRAALGNYQAAIHLDPRQAGARAAMGRLYLYGGLADRAMQLAAPGLDLEPQNAQLLTVRGAANEQLGDANAALNDAKKAVELAPDDLYAVALLASVYKQRAQFAEAATVVQAGLARAPDSADLHAILAELEVAQQHPAQAETELRHIIELQPHDLPHRYSLAHFYLSQGNVDAAERVLREAIADQPQSDDAKLQLVELLGAQRGMESAAAQIERFLAGEPNNEALKLTLGQFLALNKQVERAEQTFRAVIAHAGVGADGLAARDRLAALMIGRSDLAAASSLIAEVLKENVRDDDALILRSQISLAQHQTQAAITDLRAVLRDQPNAVELMRTLAAAYRQNDESDLAEQTLRAALQISPTDFPTRLDLAQVMISLNEFEHAQSLLEQLVKENGTNLSVQELLFRSLIAQKRYGAARAVAQDIERLSPNRGLGYYLTGLIEEADQKPDAAVRQYEQALQHQTDAAEPLQAIIHLQMGRKETAAAMVRINQALAQMPANPVAHQLKGELLIEQGHPDTAVGEYRETVRLAPGWEQGYQGLALAQTMARQSEEAIKTLQAGIARGGDATATLIGDLGRLYERLKRSDDAVTLYEGVLAKDPDSIFAANNLAMLLVTYRQDRASLDRAQALAEQLASSSDVSAIDTRGWVKFKTGDLHGAETLLQQAVTKRPAEPELHYHLGMAQLGSGERQSAQRNLEAALSVDRPFVGMDEAKAALAQLKRAGSLG